MKSVKSELDSGLFFFYNKKGILENKGKIDFYIRYTFFKINKCFVCRAVFVVKSKFPNKVIISSDTQFMQSCRAIGEFFCKN